MATKKTLFRRITSTINIMRFRGLEFKGANAVLEVKNEGTLTFGDGDATKNIEIKIPG